jgi:hypothetical protein
MQVTDIIEYEDGSATITLAMTKEEHLSIMEGALLRAIKLGMAELAQEPRDDPSL